ncbi:unnamed protein product, partial [Brassica oleracea var. botrytis]
MEKLHQIIYTIFCVRCSMPRKFLAYIFSLKCNKDKRTISTHSLIIFFLLDFWFLLNK